LEETVGSSFQLCEVNTGHVVSLGGDAVGSSVRGPVEGWVTGGDLVSRQKWVPTRGGRNRNTSWAKEGLPRSPTAFWVSGQGRGGDKRGRQTACSGHASKETEVEGHGGEAEEGWKREGENEGGRVGGKRGGGGVFPLAVAEKFLLGGGKLHLHFGRQN